ncbi:WD40-repeat-containing domain protein [Tribonema minus]|uniref:WD40-repeat-containing domain protein n=1 Tax=Tribonema minus TaxID=303371 RepID=A0A835ZGH6_9STRA|nr:WD40-repeat-containing domain protein [Tribonema minus]
MDTTDAPQIIEHIHKSLDYTTYVTRWVPCSARLLVAGISPKAKGVMQVYEMDRGALKLVDEQQKSAGIKCSTFGASSLEDRHVACGDYEGKVSIYDLERNDKPVFSVQAHSSLVNAIDGTGGPELGYGAPELVSAGRDGCVRVWDPRVQQPVLSLEPEEGTAARDCWCVAFGNSYNDEERMVCAGYDNGDVKMFDLRANAVMWETNVANGVTSVEFDRRDIEMNKLAVTTLESKFRIFDLRTQHPTDGFSCLTERAHKSTIWLAKHLPQNRDLFMTAGGNGGFNLYKYRYPNNRVTQHKDGHPMGVAGSVELLNSRVISTQPIVSFDWSPDKAGLCCLASLDQSLRIFIVTKLDKY